MMYCARFIQQAAPVLMPSISDEFGLTSTLVGSYSTFWAIASTVASVISGRLSDNYGVKKVLMVALPFLALGIFLHGFAGNYSIILAGSVVAGFGFSAIAPCTTKYIRTHAEVSKRGGIQGLVMAGLDLGALSVSILLPFLAVTYNWRITFQLAALLPFIAFFPLLFHLKEGEYVCCSGTRRPFFTDLRNLLEFKPFWNVALLSFLMSGVVSSTLAHFSMFLYETFSFNPVDAGIGFSFVFIGGAAGRLLGGIVSDRFFPYRRHIALGLFAALAGAASILFILLTGIGSVISAPVIWVTAFIAGIGIFGENPIRYIMAAELVKGENSGFIIGTNFLAARMGFMLIPPLFGILVDLTGTYASGWSLMVLMVIATIARVLFWPAGIVKEKTEISIG